MKFFKSPIQTFPVLLFIVLLFPNFVQAHTGEHLMNSGLSHPFLGIDHMLAALAVGVIAVQMAGKASWRVPASFLGFMVLGGLSVLYGVQLPMMETGIALSILILGAVMAFSKKTSLTSMIAYVGFFALFHGQAHAAEILPLSRPLLYAIGLLLSTAALHAAGMVAAHYIKKTQFSPILRYAGVGIAVIGVTFMAGF